MARRHRGIAQQRERSVIADLTSTRSLYALLPGRLPSLLTVFRQHTPRLYSSLGLNVGSIWSRYTTTRRISDDLRLGAALNITVFDLFDPLRHLPLYVYSIAAL